jgi:heme/copper-type cytochrome/quinol oxidase subunit 3
MIYFYLYFLSIFIVFSFSFPGSYVSYVSYWFSSLLSFVWIGGQFPQDNFLSYGRILTLYYYFLLICISFILVILHIFNLHFLSSNNPLSWILFIIIAFSFLGFFLPLLINDSLYSCLFFTITGLHFFHLVYGLLLLSLLFWSCSFSSLNSYRLRERKEKASRNWFRDD